ncbi:MAG: spiro-SPASM protein [Spirochaetota bacterium]
MVLCLYNSAPAEYLAEPIKSRSALERVVAYAGELSVAGVAIEAVRLYSTVELRGVPEEWVVERGPELDESGLIEFLVRCGGAETDEYLVAQADQPFLNAELTARLVRRHREYLAQYTFADGYPHGLAPELVARSAIAHLRSLAGDAPVTRAGLFPIVQKDINRLDVETELSAVDQRLLRLELAVNTRGNLLLCQRLAEDAPTAIDEWPAHVEARRLAHRTRPAFVSVQIVEQEVHRLAYSPYPTMRDDVLAPGRIMERARFESLVHEVKRFAPEAVVQVSLWGEASLHPELRALVDAVLDSPSLSLLVETSGVGWSDADRAHLFAIDDPRLMVIVGLDTISPELYARIRGAGFEEAVRFAEEAVGALGGRAWVQAVRSELTEPELDAFFRHWREKTSNVIIQKYDHFSGRLPQRKIGDISPLRRFPCWHLQRDLYVAVDGRVPLCREDIAGEHVLGNVFTDGIESVWAAAAGHFADHVEGRYRSICEACDEYYTYTF